MSTLSTISIAVVSATFGAFIGYYIGDKRLAGFYHDECEQEIEAMEEYYRKTYEINEETTETPRADRLVGSIEAKSSVPDVPLDRKNYKSYATKVEVYDTTDEDEIPVVNDPRTLKRDQVDIVENESGIKFVKAEVFTENYDHFENQEEFIYYPDAELLVDFWGERVTDPERYLGNDYLDHLPDAETAEESEVGIEKFVMNYNTETRIHIEVNSDMIPDGTFKKNEYYIYEKRAQIEGARRRVLARQAGIELNEPGETDAIEIIDPREGGEL